MAGMRDAIQRDEFLSFRTDFYARRQDSMDMERLKKTTDTEDIS
jgi:queuine/archaeosine tRNA-ribosyltransferase